MAAASFLAAIFTGCHASPKQVDPAIIFQSIHDDFLHGNLDIAQQRAETARNEFSGRSDEWSVKFRLLEAEILTYQGRRTDVLQLLTARDVSYSSIGDIPIKRDLLCGLAHAGLGQLEQGEEELREARLLSDSSKSKLDGELLRAEAKIQTIRGDSAKATELYKQSLQAARQEGDLFLEASDLLNLGWVELHEGHYDEAVTSLNAAADFARPIQARPVLEAALGDLGEAYFQLGDFEKALSTSQQAEQESKKIGTTSASVDWLWNAGSSNYELGRLQEAKAYFDQSLEAAVAINDPVQIAGTNTELAMLLLKEGQLASAKVNCDAALKAARSSGDKSAELGPLFVQALLAERTGDGKNSEQMLLKLNDDSTGIPSLKWEIQDALGDFYNENHQPRQAELWYRKSISTFEAKRAEVKDEEHKLPFFANGDALYRDYAKFLILSGKQNEALNLFDLGRARTLAEGLKTSNKKSTTNSITEINPESVARKLDATILFYSLGPEKSYLWAVTDSRIHLFELPKQKEIETRVESYQKAILRSSDALREANADGRYLYDALVAPAASMIPNGAKVFIIPDGALNGLNFETLLKPSAEKVHYWIEDVTVTNANSIRLLSRLDHVASFKGASNLLLIGDPISSSSEYESLQNAPAEVDEIKKHFGVNRETLLTRADAVPSAYGTIRPDRFAYIHFVAHGTASRLSPLDSAVVLTASAAHPDDYKLYAREIIHHPLHARLVTISSCYGSGLRAYAGEELVGLSWAFLRAGAHNVIGALWEVNDASTPQLMDQLYGGLERGNNPDEALRAAKLSMMHSDGITRKPMYWAAFQLYAGS